MFATGFARRLHAEGLSGKEAAARTDISETAISRYASGQQFPRRVHRLRLFAEFPGLTANDFLPPDELSTPCSVEVSA